MPEIEGPTFRSAMREQELWIGEQYDIAAEAGLQNGIHLNINEELRQLLAPLFAEARVRIGVDPFPERPLTFTVHPWYRTILTVPRQIGKMARQKMYDKLFGDQPR